MEEGTFEIDQNTLVEDLPIKPHTHLVLPKMEEDEQLFSKSHISPEQPHELEAGHGPGRY